MTFLQKSMETKDFRFKLALAWPSRIAWFAESGGGMSVAKNSIPGGGGSQTQETRNAGKDEALAYTY
jgi:hypothetical protein